jgi:hypothetical protein
MPARPRQPCTQPGCPKLTTGGRCPDHKRQADKARGTRQERGYDADHDTLRAQLMLTAIGKICASPSCTRRMLPGQRLALMHNEDRTGYLGMGHAQCNLSDAGKAAHR